jgi:EAL domain-containing protein (putative c-di-GMP-specific phosphodiesterase class I)
MRTACAQAQRWVDDGLPAIRVAVNVSGRAFLGSRVCERVAETLTSTGLDPHRLELEITESMAIDQGVDTRPTFRELERLGVRLAIDDFGTGYSALSRLQGYPFHTLKIDRSFVSGIEHADDEAPIVAAMIAMAHALGLEVVAEGVETSEQRGFLSGHACDLAQGYLFSRPVAPDAVEVVLRSRVAA